jgi:hypothetical protein
MLRLRRFLRSDPFQPLHSHRGRKKDLGMRPSAKPVLSGVEGLRMTSLKGMLPKPGRRQLFAQSCGFLIVLGLLLGIYASSLPRFRDVTQAEPGLSPVEAQIPYRFDSAGTAIEKTVSFTMSLRTLHPSRYHILPDDCLHTLVINGRAVTDPTIPFCDYQKGRILDLSPYLRTGDNAVSATIRNDGGSGMFDISYSWDDPLFGALGISLLTLLLLYGLLAVYLLRGNALSYGIYGTFVLAAVLRVAYFLATPYWVRGHDVDGHIDYARFLTEHFTLPKDGWEAWQPPLYYFLESLVLRFGELMQWSDGNIHKLMQLTALPVSLLTWGCAVWILRMAFPKREHGRWVILGSALFAVHPGLIYNAARINNDVLSVFLAFVTVAFLLRWWTRGGIRSYYLAAMATGLHWLTKSTAPLLIPVQLGMLLFAKGMGWKKKLMHGALALALMGMMYGWVPATRAMLGHDRSSFIGNSSGLQSALRLENRVSSYAVFDPAGMVDRPYNNPWDDAARRQYFWEYWYRSGFFGEFDFGAERKLVAQWMLGLSFLLFPLALIGLIAGFRLDWRRTLPFALLLVILPLGHAVFRFQFPYGSSQDFRYSLAVLIPFFVLAIQGIMHLPNLLQRACSWLLQLLCALCVVFLLSL